MWQVSKMRCAEVSGPGEPPRLVDHAIPESPKGGAIIKTSYAGVCHSDVLMQDGFVNMGEGQRFYVKDQPGFTYPIILGHEVSGVIHSIHDMAKNESGLKVGDRVVVYPCFGCSECIMCTTGNNSLCKDRGLYSLGHGMPGGFASFVSVPDTKFLVKVPDGLEMDVASLTPCGGITSYNGVSRVKRTIEELNEIKGATNLLIIGAGGLGMWALQIARQVLPKTTRLYVADVSEAKLKNAMEAGADDVLLWNMDASEEVLGQRSKNKFGDAGVDAVIDFVNNGTTNKRALGVLNTEGTMACVGMFGGRLNVILANLTLRAHTITGVLVGSMRQLKELLQLLADQKLKGVPITRYKLDDVEEVLNTLRAGKITGRAVIEY